MVESKQSKISNHIKISEVKYETDKDRKHCVGVDFIHSGKSYEALYEIMRNNDILIGLCANNSTLFLLEVNEANQNQHNLALSVAQFNKKNDVIDAFLLVLIKLINIANFTKEEIITVFSDKDRVDRIGVFVDKGWGYKKIANFWDISYNRSKIIIQKYKESGG